MPTSSGSRWTGSSGRTRRDDGGPSIAGGSRVHTDRVEVEDMSEQITPQHFHEVDVATWMGRD